MTRVLSPRRRNIKNQKDRALSPAHRKACAAPEPITILVTSSLRQGMESAVLHLANLKSRPGFCIPVYTKCTYPSVFQDPTL